MREELAFYLLSKEMKKYFITYANENFQKSAKRLIISTNNYQNLKALAKNWTTNVAYLNKKAKADLNKSKRHFQNTKN